MSSPGVASHARLQGFGQVVVLTECGHGVMARRSSPQHLHCATLHTPHWNRDRYLPVTVSTSCVVRARRSLFTAPPGTPDELAGALAWSGIATTSSNKGIDAQMHELCSDLVAQLRNGREQWMRAFSGP